MTKGWPHNSPDEFGPYLNEQLRNPDVRAAYETEQTNEGENEMTIDPINNALQIAPAPTERSDATRGPWVRHYAAQALAAYATFRGEIRNLTPNPVPGSRPDLGYLMLIATSATAATVALTNPIDAPELIWDLTPEAGALNGEYEDWLTDTLVRYGINPGHIDPDLDPADFAIGDRAVEQINAFQAERGGEQVTA